MGKLTLYGIPPSPPVRAVLLTLNALDLPYEFVTINLFAHEERSDEYLKKNPHHTVPTLEDDGHFIGDSHAINAYLVDKYAETDALYPKDCLQRSVVDQRLFYDAGSVFYNTLRAITRPLLLENQTDVPQKKLDAINEVYDVLEAILQDQDYVAGDQLTIADFSLITSVLTTNFFVPVDAAKYAKLSAWVKRIEALPYFEKANGEGAKIITELFKSKPINVVP